MIEDERYWQIGRLSSNVDDMKGQIRAIWAMLERWDIEQSRDQATLRTMLAVIALLLVALGAVIVWAEDRAHTRAEVRIQALELRVNKLEAVAGGD